MRRINIVGELKRIHSITKIGNGFIVYGESSQTCYLQFSLSGELLDSVFLNNYYREIELMDGKLVGLLNSTFYSEDINQDHCLFGFKGLSDEELLFSTLNKYKQKIKIPRSDSLFGTCGTITHNGNSILFTNSSINFIYRYYPSDQSSESFYINEKMIDDPEVKNGEWVRSTLINSDICFDEKSNLIVVGSYRGYQFGERFRVNVFNEDLSLNRIYLIENMPEFISLHNNKMIVADSMERMNIMLYDYSFP